MSVEHSNWPIYEARDIAYDRIEATRGRIYQIVIKKVITSTEEYLNGSEDFYTYVDTLNSVHLEENLIDYETAAKLTGVIYFSGGVVYSGTPNSYAIYNINATGLTYCSGAADNEVV